mgnify:CR=1 FL=1
MQSNWLRILLGFSSGGLLYGALFSQPIVAQTLPVRVEQWLEVYSFRGDVELLRQGQRTSAQVGQRLSRVGEGLQTGGGSSAVLAVDTQIGFINLSENTRLRLDNIEALPSGGRITEIFIERGQARLQTRPFTNPDTRFDLRTPAATTSVRGTLYGVSVQPDGRTGVATETGAVEVSAAGESVTVNAGFQSQVVPGNPPTPPAPLSNDPSLDLRLLQASNGQVLVQGQIDPVNLLLIREKVQTVEPDGSFRLELPLGEDRRIPVTVVTPLGREQAYELQVP